MRGERFHAAEGQQRGHAEGEAGAVPHLEAAGIDQLRQVLAAVIGRRAERIPAACDPGLIGLLETRRRGDDAVAQLDAVAVAAAVDRRDHLAGEAPGFLQDVLHQVERQIAVDAVADRAVEPADVSHQEQHLIDGRTVGHGAAPPVALWRSERPACMAAGRASLKTISGAKSSAL